MKKIILTLSLVIFLFSQSISFSQSYDVNYTIEYALKKADGTEVSRMKFFRNGNQMKFLKMSDSGTPQEAKTEIFINKDDRKIYQIISNSTGKYGSKFDLDVMMVGMQTGVYILDLGNVDLFNAGSLTGTGTVLGKACKEYTIVMQSNGTQLARSVYYIYQDNLMLKRSVGSDVEGNAIEALSYNTAVVPSSVFDMPADITWMN